MELLQDCYWMPCSCLLWMAASSLVILTKIWSALFFIALLEMVLVMTALSFVFFYYLFQCLGNYFPFYYLSLIYLWASSLLDAAFCGFQTSYCTENMSLCWMQQVSTSTAIYDVNGYYDLLPASLRKSQIFLVRLLLIFPCVFQSFLYLLKEKTSQIQSMRDWMDTAARVEALAPEKYQMCFYCRNYWLLMRKRLNSERFCYYAILFLLLFRGISSNKVTHIAQNDLYKGYTSWCCEGNVVFVHL